LRELYQRSQAMEKAAAGKGVRDFLERIHRVLNLIDATPLTTIAGGAWSDVWWRVGAGAGLRFDHRG